MVRSLIPTPLVRNGTPHWLQEVAAPHVPATRRAALQDQTREDLSAPSA